MAYRWSDYYKEAKAAYQKKNGETKPLVDLYDLTIKVCDPSNQKETDILTLDETYLSIVDSLAASVDAAFQEPQNCERKGMAFGLKNIWDFPQLNELCELLVPQMEKKVFGSHVHVDNIKFYRSFITDERPTTSWLWHFDNNPKEQVKILIYLTDVEDGSGQFEFIMDPSIRGGIKVPTSRPNWDEWIDTGHADFILDSYDVRWRSSDRVPLGVVEYMFSNGLKQAKVLGKRGKLLLFDNNIIHRGTVARKTHRDVMTIQFKPSIKKINPTIAEAYTGSWEHTTFNVDPSVQKVLPATADNAAMNQLGRIQDSMAGDNVQDNDAMQYKKESM